MPESISPGIEEAPPPPPAPIAARAVRRDSWAALLIGGVILAGSFALSPDPRGYGTHERVSLVPCVFRLVTRQPCPFCGMTTGFCHLARGQVAAAARCNLLAPLGFVATILAVIGGLYGVVTRRNWLPEAVFSVTWHRAVIAVVAAVWIANLVSHNWPQPR